MTAIVDPKTMVHQLLTDLAVRVQGVLDMWTVVCVTRVPPDVRGFINILDRLNHLFRGPSAA